MFCNGLERMEYSDSQVLDGRETQNTKGPLQGHEIKMI